MSKAKGLRKPKNERLLSGIERSDSFQTLQKSKFRKVRSVSILGKEKPKQTKGIRSLNWRANSELYLQSRTSWLQRSQSDRSIGSLPKVPHRLLSPLGRKVLLRNTGRLKQREEWDFLLQETKQMIIDPKIAESPFEIPGSSSEGTTIIVSPTTDIESVILARLPSHIKGQLSLEEWSRVLEPTKLREHNTSYTVCQKPSGTRKSDKAYDALYCTEDWSKTRETGNSRRRRVEETSFEQQSLSSVESNQTSVSFGTVTVRRYERILVVHPCTSSGPSLGIGWNYEESSESLDLSHPSGGDLRLSRDLRERMVKRLGYSTREVACAVREGLRIKNQRRRTINNLQSNVVDVEKVEYIAEKCNRKLRKLHAQFHISGSV